MFAKLQVIYYTVILVWREIKQHFSFFRCQKLKSKMGYIYWKGVTDKKVDYAPTGKAKVIFCAIDSFLNFCSAKYVRME